MKQFKLLQALCLIASIPASALAAPTTYEGILVSGLAQSGSAGGFSWFLDDGANVGFWSFTANAGDMITLEVDRLNANFDPALTLYAGTTTADVALFDSASSWGGMTFIGSLDDENPPFMSPGPDGDPFGTFKVTATGTYTVAVGGSLSTDTGPYPYRVVMTDVAAPVPEPAVYQLMALGIAGLGFVARRRR